MTQSMLAAVEARSRAAIQEADDVLLTAQAACMIAVLTHKLPAEVLTGSSAILVFPELITRTCRRESFAGVCIEFRHGVPSNARFVRLDGAGVERLRGPGGLFLVARERIVGEAVLSGRLLGSDILVLPGPVGAEDLPDAPCSLLCWYFSAGHVFGATVAEAAIRFEHTPSNRNRSSLLKAVSSAVRKSIRTGRALRATASWR